MDELPITYEIVLQVAIVGVGLTKWGVRQAMYKELVQEAVKALFDDVEGLHKKDVDSLFVGSALVDRLAFQAYPAPLVAEQLGIEPRHTMLRSVERPQSQLIME